MTEAERKIFRSTVTYDLTKYKEFVAGIRNLLPYTMILGVDRRVRADRCLDNKI